MYYESSKLQTYFLKFGPLVFAIIVGANTWQYFLDLERYITPLLSNLATITLLLIIFFYLKDRLRIVAVGKQSLLINYGRQETEYSWTEVHSIELNRFFGIYKLELEDDIVYFIPYNWRGPLFGDMSEMGTIISKNKRDLDL